MTLEINDNGIKELAANITPLYMNIPKSIGIGICVFPRPSFKSTSYNNFLSYFPAQHSISRFYNEHADKQPWYL